MALKGRFFTALTKLEIAEHQLTTALRLWLKGGDEASIITLAHASQGAVSGKFKGRTSPFTMMQVRLKAELARHQPLAKALVALRSELGMKGGDEGGLTAAKRKRKADARFDDLGALPAALKHAGDNEAVLIWHKTDAQRYLKIAIAQFIGAGGNPNKLMQRFASDTQWLDFPHIAPAEVEK